jgi:hypothetical protein
VKGREDRDSILLWYDQDDSTSMGKKARYLPAV